MVCRKVVVARALREAGWLTSGARGVNAPDMGARDAARLSLALLTGEPPSKAIPVFGLLRTLQTVDEYPSAGFLNRETLPHNHTLEDAITALFEASANPELIAEYGEEKITHVMAIDDDLVDGYDMNTVTHTAWPKFSVAIDMSRRTAEVHITESTFHYVDLVGREKVKLYQTKSSFNLHDTEEILERMDRSPSAAEVDGVVMGQGMRVVRTITEQEFKRISLADCPDIIWKAVK
jgi:hypothetical protein